MLEELFISSQISHPEFEGDLLTFHEGNEQYTPTFSFLFLFLLRNFSNISSEQWSAIETNFKMVCGNNYTHENWQKNKVKLFELIEASKLSKNRKSFVNQVSQENSSPSESNFEKFDNQEIVAQQQDTSEDTDIVIDGKIYRLLKKQNFPSKKPQSGF